MIRFYVIIISVYIILGKKIIMRTSTKLIIAGSTIGVVIAGVLIAKNSISIDKENHNVHIIGGADGPTSVFLAGKVPADRERAKYTSISMEEAKKIFATPGDYIILDVRRADEFAEGHIPGAINIANEDIGAEKPSELPDPDQAIYVYCKSGRRSKDASAKLAALGYTNVYSFGGILDWDGKIEK